MEERQVIPYTTRDEWLATRTADVTSTDAAALFGLSPWKSRYRLWQEKRNNAPSEIDETPAMRWGRRFEAAIGYGIAEDEGLDVEPFKDYVRLPAHRVGSSFDFVAKDRSFVFEIKKVGTHAFREGWVETDFGLEAPATVEAQVQHEMMVSGIHLAYIGAWVDDRTYLLRREYQADVGTRILEEADKFWRSEAPEPDFRVDSQFIARMCNYAEPGKVLDADTELTELLAQYAEYGRQKRIAEDEQDAAKARILLRIGDAERVNSEIGTLSAGVVKGAHIEYDRKEYRGFRFSERRKK